MEASAMKRSATIHNCTIDVDILQNFGRKIAENRNVPLIHAKKRCGGEMHGVISTNSVVNQIHLFLGTINAKMHSFI